MSPTIIILLLLVITSPIILGAPNVNQFTPPHPIYQKDIIEELPPHRIVNGLDASKDQFPYQVSITWGVIGDRSHICGGSIVSSTTVLTAGHCILSYGSYVIVAGNLNLDEDTDSTQRRNVSSILEHPEWPGGSQVASNDIAIIRVGAPFKWTSSVQPVSLPDIEDTFNGTAILSGWGRTSSLNPFLPTVLQYAQKDLLTQEECADTLTDILGSSGVLDDSMICTSGKTHISACNGDSGGPLVQNGVLIGVVSWGISPCGIFNAPSVYTRTTTHVEWIINNTDII